MLSALSPLALALHFDFFVLTALINLIACGLLGGYILARSKGDSVLRLFASYNLCAALWSLCYLLWQLSGNSLTATIFTRLLMAFATFLPLLYFLFARRFLEVSIPWVVEGLLSLLFTAFAVLCMISPLVVAGITPQGGFPYWPVAGPILSPLLACWFAVLLLTLFLLVQATLRTASPRRRSQMLALLAGNIIAYAGGATNFFLWYGIPIPPWGNLTVLAVPLATLYAIARYRLFDLRLIIKLALVYTALLTTLLLGYALVAYALPAVIGAIVTGQQEQLSWRGLLISAAPAMLTALIVLPVQDRLNEFAERFLFRKDRERRAILNKLYQELNEVDNLEDALRMILIRLKEAFELSHIAVVLFPSESPSLLVQNTARSQIQQLGYPGRYPLNEKDLHALRECLHSVAHLYPNQRGFPSHRRPLVQSELRQLAMTEVEVVRRRVTYSALRQYYASHTQSSLAKTAALTLSHLGAELAVPLYQGETLIGALLLSRSSQATSFNMEELSLLDLVASQAISAIQKAQLFEEDRSQGEFVSIASHELLSPISSMVGNLEFVLESKPDRVDNQARGYLYNVATSARRLLAMVTDLLSVSRIESGQLSYKMQEVDLPEVVEEAVAQLVFTAKEKGLDLRYRRPGNIPQIWVDRDRMMQVVINLLSNAIKYTPSGHVEVTITTDANQVCLSVRDTGIGMNREQMSHLFQKFSRITTSETANIPGTGMGLYITKSIVEKMAGQISVKSEPGSGSVFTVAFPATLTAP